MNNCPFSSNGHSNPSSPKRNTYGIILYTQYLYWMSIFQRDVPNIISCPRNEPWCKIKWWISTKELNGLDILTSNSFSHEDNWNNLLNSSEVIYIWILPNHRLFLSLKRNHFSWWFGISRLIILILSLDLKKTCWLSRVNFWDNH